MSSLEKLAAEQKAEQDIPDLLERFTRQGRNTCENPSSPTYAPTRFAKESEAPRARHQKSRPRGRHVKTFCSQQNLPPTLWATVQGNLQTGAQMICRTPVQPPAHPCRTLCAHPPYTPGRLHSLPACTAGAARSGHTKDARG